MAKGIKGYKVFNNDWTCNKFQYEIGKEYEYEGKIDMCKSGFHFCKKLQDCFGFYASVPWNKIAEVKGYGKIIENKDDSKICCSKIKILKEISLDDIAKIYGISSSQGIYSSKGISSSEGISFSYGISYSEGISSSQGISSSKGISSSQGIYSSKGIFSSEGISSSYGISYSKGISSSKGIAYSEGISSSQGIYSSKGISSSEGISSSYGLKNCSGISNAIFCSNLKSSYKLFNKKITRERYEEIRNKLNSFGWYPKANNAHELYLKSGGEWQKTPIPNISIKNMWDDLPKEMIEYIKSLPEYDDEIFKEITK